MPVDSDTRPKKEEKRKRKRIPIEKKEVKREDLFKDRRDGDATGRRVSLIVAVAVQQARRQKRTRRTVAVAAEILEEERIKKLIKKKYRKRSGKPRPNYAGGGGRGAKA